MVHRLRIAGLDDPALRHHGDAITGLEGFRLVVSDVDRRQSEAMHQVAHLGAEPDLKLEVQVAQRLVHQQDAGLEGQCPRQRHPLLLAAAQRDDRPFRQGIEAEHLEHLADADPHRVSFHLQAAAAEGKGDVFEHVHVRPDGVGLEHHGDGAPVGGHENAVLGVEDGVPVDADLAPGGPFQPGDGTQHGGLAATRRTQQDKELARGDVQVDAAQRVHDAVPQWELRLKTPRLQHRHVWAFSTLPGLSSLG